MPAEPPDPSPDHVEPPADAIDRAAALDDFFGGLTASPASDAVGRLADDAPLPGSLDLLLLLRQVGAQGGSPPESPPEKIGRYNVRRLAGRGGFSLVWEAFDPVLRRRVAVKVCTPDALISPSVRRRFRREAELASRLVHPHIVTIHEVGEADGLEFITSEFCAGGSLADWLVRYPRPVPPPVAAKIVRALAHAAAHAHESGIIHRDIKPGNVMLVPVDDRDSSACIIPPQRDTSEADATPGMTVKLVDFGLGRQNDPGDGDDPLTQLTTEGARLGTPAWMAPEQIDRSFGPVGPATDVHAIGLLLHRMLTGRPLRGGKTDIETYREVLLDEPPAANWVARGVPPDLGAVCLKCLAKQPEGRYASAAALADDLSRWLAGLPTRARPLSPLQRLGRGVARRPLVAALLTAAMLATALAGWASLERSRELRAAAVHREEILRQNAAAELRRGFESLRSANVAGALDQLAKTRRIDPVLADSLAGRCLARRLHGEREILMRPDPDAVESRRRIDLHAVAVSDDGRTIAAGGSDGVLRVIRAFDDHSSLTEISAHDEINDVSVSSDGRLVASVGQDGRLRWWTADAGGDLAGEAPPVGCPLYAVAFSDEDTEIYYGGEDRTLRRIRLTDGSVPQEVHRFPWSGNAAPEIEVMSRVGTMLVVACGGSLAAFDTADERLLWSWNREAGDPSQAIFHALEISPDGRRVAAGGTDRELRIWDGQTGKLLTTVSGHPNWIQACRFSADGTLLATASRDGVVRVFDATTAALVGKLVGHAGRVWDIDFDPDGSLVSAGGDGTLRRWECRDPILPRPLRDLPVPGHEVVTIRDASFDGQGRLVALRMGACPVLIDVQTGALTELEVDEYPTHHGVAVDHRRKRIAYGSSVTRLSCSPCVMQAEAGTWRRQPAAAAIRGIAVGPYICWTPDGRLVSASQTGEVFMWSPMLEIVTKVADVLSDYRSAAAPAGPPRVAIASRPGSIIRLDQDGAIVAPPLLLEDVGDHVATLAWSPDGLKLTGGLRNGSVHVFDAMTGRCVGMLAPHEQQVVDAAYSADGRVVVTADGECLRVSDAATLTTFDEIRPGWRIQSMCLGLDGSFAAIAGWASGTAAGQPAREARLAILDLEP